MYNYNTTFWQRWRINLVPFGLWCWFVYHLTWDTTTKPVWEGGSYYRQEVVWANPNYPWQGAVWLGVMYLLLTGLICAYNQFIFQRDVKRNLEMRRRIARGEFQGTGDWT